MKINTNGVFTHGEHVAKREANLLPKFVSAPEKQQK